MFLVTMETFANSNSQPLIIAETLEKAQEYIDQEMNGSVYNGTGVHKITKMKVFK